MKNNEIFKMPNRYSVSGRSSTITAAVWKSIMPFKEPTIEQIEDCLATLGMSTENVHCAYCGAKNWSSWDHLFAVVKGKEYTGYVTDIFNLVPACSKCNSSKGNSNWKEWMKRGTGSSPASRVEKKRLDSLIRRLDAFVSKYDSENRRLDMKPFERDKEKLKKEKDSINKHLEAIQNSCDVLQRKIQDEYERQFTTP
ncbi:MAG: HNH endonuclease [Flavobacteriales bacterium]|nr:HNH endonuclease [Flavobacteriales bacterium]